MLGRTLSLGRLIGPTRDPCGLFNVSIAMLMFYQVIQGSASQLLSFSPSTLFHICPKGAMQWHELFLAPQARGPLRRDMPPERWANAALAAARFTACAPSIKERFCFVSDGSSFFDAAVLRVGRPRGRDPFLSVLLFLLYILFISAESPPPLLIATRRSHFVLRGPLRARKLQRTYLPTRAHVLTWIRVFGRKASNGHHLKRPHVFPLLVIFCCEQICSQAEQHWWGRIHSAGAHWLTSTILKTAGLQIPWPPFHDPREHPYPHPRSHRAVPSLIYRSPSHDSPQYPLVEPRRLHLHSLSLRPLALPRLQASPPRPPLIPPTQ